MSSIDPRKDYYTALGVSPGADEAEIKRAYREKARIYHPDSGQGDPAHFRLVQEAYEVLRDPLLRRAYDQQQSDRGLSANSPFTFDMLLSRTKLPVMDVPQLLYVMLDIHAQGELSVSRQRLNLALVIDRSTSMQGARMRNVKMAAMDLIDAMNKDDRIALVAFSDRADVLIPSSQLKDKRSFAPAVASLNPGGGTEIYQGLLAGIKEVERYASDNSINHVILLTDGRTYGDEDLALAEARRAATNDVGISAFGIGEDWNDIFLDDLARFGGGVSEYVSSPAQVQDVLHEQIQGLSNTLARKMYLHVKPASYVELQAAYRAVPYMEILRSKEPNVFKLGSLSTDEPTVVVLELVVKPHEGGERRITRVEVNAEDVMNPQPTTLWQDVKVNFLVGAVEDESVPPRLLNFLARLSVFRLQEQAWDALEGGDSRQATRFLEAAATRLFDMGYNELAHAAMLEVSRIAQGGDPTDKGRKQLRYGTRSLSIPSSKSGRR